jgi:hypothetical protein
MTDAAVRTREPFPFVTRRSITTWKEKQRDWQKTFAECTTE